MGIRDKLRAGVNRIRKLRRRHTSIDQFMCISNVLLGGLAGAYLQSAYASFDETEGIEKSWRNAFCRFSKRDFRDPVAELYAPAPGWTKGRTHIYCVGSAALFAAVEKAMADRAPSPARAAVRSMVALALYSWGCRSNPCRWVWRHLEEELRSTLRGRGARHLGDAWMLACIELEKGRDPIADKAIRDEEMRLAD